MLDSKVAFKEALDARKQFIESEFAAAKAQKADLTKKLSDTDAYLIRLQGAFAEITELLKQLEEEKPTE